MPFALPTAARVSPPIRVVIDRQLCQGHGVCALEAPEVFAVVESEDGSYAEVRLLVEEPEAALRPEIEAAVRYCPNRVLSIDE